MKIRASASLALLLIFNAVGFLFAEENPVVPTNYLCTWENEKRTVRIGLRLADDGSYDAVVVWVADTAAEKIKTVLGKPFAVGFKWNTSRGRFQEGRIVTGTTESREAVSCSFVPKGPNVLELVLRMGLLSRTSKWLRVSIFGGRNGPSVNEHTPALC